ncbi:hypothetical protein WI67_00045 [Burkholderia cepacia]|nr:hypothetical protein WI67_00045 [Burkholderia cepacia]
MHMLFDVIEFDPDLRGSQAMRRLDLDQKLPAIRQFQLIVGCVKAGPISIGKRDAYWLFTIGRDLGGHLE